MKLSAWLSRGLRMISGLLLGLLWGLAWLLSPWRIGRLVRVVSLPRFADHPLRTSLTLLGVSLGVAGIMAVVLVNRSVMRAATGTVADIAGRSDLQISAGTGSLPDALLDRVRAVPGVARAVPVLQNTCVLRDSALRGERVVFVGLDLVGGDESYFRPSRSPELEAIRRDPLSFLNSSSNVIVTAALARDAKRGLHDKLEITTPAGVQTFEIWGMLGDSGTTSAFGGAVAIMHYQAMQVAFNRGTDLDRIDVALAAGASLDGVRSALQVELGPTFRVESPDASGSRIRKMLTGLQASLSVGSLIALLIGMFLIYNTMQISVAQRKRELGILRALGTTRGQLVRLLTLEGMLIGFAASLLGVGIGIAIAFLMLHGMTQAVSRVYVPISGTELDLDAALVAGCLVLGVLASAVSAAIPASLASRVLPAQTLRTGSLMTTRPVNWRMQWTDIAGLALLAGSVASVHVPPVAGVPVGAFAACMFLLLGAALVMRRVIQAVHHVVRGTFAKRFGVEVQMANENLPRDLTRTSITAAGLMMGVAMATGFAVFIGSFIFSTMHWLEESIPADLFITRSAAGAVNNVPLADALTEPIRRIPGVETVERVRISDTVFKGLPIKLVAAEMELYSRYANILLTEGDQREVVESLASGKGVVLSENLARKLGLHRGDRIELAGRGRMMRFVIAGVRVDYTTDLGTIMLERSLYVREFQDDAVDMFKIHTRPGADVEAIRRQLNSAYARTEDLFVLTGHEFRSEMAKLLDRVFAVLRALQGVAISIAAFGIVNALLASILDRVREFGVLRAVGMLRRQLRRMIVSESVLVGVSGCILGVLVGLYLGFIMTEYVNIAYTGWTFVYRPNWSSLVEMGVMVLVVCLVAGWYPARQAAARPIVSALSYE